METPGFLRDLVLLFSLAVFVVVFFHRIRIPPLVGFLFAGIVAGPSGLGLIADPRSVESLADIGVVLLLFTIGLDLSLERLVKMRTALLLGGSVQVLGTGAAFAGIAWAFLSLNPPQAVFIGMLAALSSTAIVLKVFADAGEIDSPHGHIVLGISIFQDICVVPMMILAPFLGGRELSGQGILWTAAKAIAMVAGSLLAGRHIVPWILQQVVRIRSRELFLLVIIVLCIGTAYLSSLAGLSLALGAFIAGLIISHSEYSHQALGEIIPFRDAFSSLFMISMGMLLDLRQLQEPFSLLLALAVVVGLKALIAGAATLTLRYPLAVAVTVGLSLAQVGEFSFVLARGAHDAIFPGTGGEKVYQLFIAVAVLSMALMPLLKSIAPSVADRVLSLVPRRPAGAAKGPPAMEAAERAEGHVIVVGYGINGRNLTQALKRVSIPYVVVEMNPNTVAAERRKGEPIMYGDASRPEILEHAGIRRARVLVIAISDPSCMRRATHLARRLNPGLHIIVRTRYLQEMKPLLDLGASEVIPEEFETALEIFARTLRWLLVPRDMVEKFLQELRLDGYGALRSGRPAPEARDGVQDFLGKAQLEVFRIEHGSPVEGKPLGESEIRRQTGATIIALKVGDQFVPNPSVTTRLEAGLVAIVFGTPEQVAAAATLFRAPARIEG